MDELQRQITENETHIKNYNDKIREFEQKLPELRYNLQNDYKGIIPTKEILRTNPHFAEISIIKKNINHLNKQIKRLTNLNANLSLSLRNKKKIENRKTSLFVRESPPTVATSLNNKEEEEKEEEELKKLLESSTQKETKNRRNNGVLEGLLENKNKNTPLFSDEDDNINNEINQMNNEDNIQSIREKKQRELEETQQKKQEDQKELERTKNMDLLFKNQLNEHYNKSNLKTKKSTKINKTRNKTRKNIPKEIQMKTFKGDSDKIEYNDEPELLAPYYQKVKPAVTSVGPIQIRDDDLDSKVKFLETNKPKGNKVNPFGLNQIRDAELVSEAKSLETNKLTPVGPSPSKDTRVAINLTEQESKEGNVIGKSFRETLTQTKKNVKPKSKNPNIICCQISYFCCFSEINT